METLILTALVLAFVISILVVIFLLYSAYGTIAGAPYVPTKNYKLKIMMQMAAIKPGEVVYDLGSGDGRLVRLAAEAGADAHGFEINPLLNIWGWYLNRRSGFHQRAHLHWRNLYSVDFSKADVVFIYLFPKPMTNLQHRMQTILRPGARVVVNGFPFPAWQPTQTEKHTYLYRV